MAAAGEKVHFAVGDDDKQCFRRALHCVPPQKTLVLVHIHRPPTMIPQMGTTIPASMLREDIVSAYRNSERSRIYTILEEYLEICTSAKVQAEILTIEEENVADGLLKLIAKHKIKTLIMGAGKSWITGRKSKLAVTLEIQADPLCNILFLHNGELISSRQQSTNVCTVGKNEISSSASCHFLSGSSNNTNSTSSSSFWDSRSTADGFDAARLDDPSLNNAASVFDDNRFSCIDHESLCRLRELGGRLIPAEHSQHLHQAFRTKRGEILTRCQSIVGIDSVLGVDCMNFEKASWKAIKSWAPELEYVVRVLKAKHTQLAKQNRGALNGLAHDDLSEAAKEHIVRLLKFAPVITKLRTSPEKLFHILYMYETLMDASPTLRKVFSAEFVSREVEGILTAMKDTARGILVELKDLIRTCCSEKIPQGGSIHLITGYLMKYIRLLVNHTASLDTILGHGHGDNLLAVDGMNSSGRLISGLISELDSMLQENSKLYASKGLQCIFLINNAHFILQEVEQSDTQSMLGDKWIEKRREDMEQDKMHYLDVSWAPIISHLEILTSPLRKRIRTSNPLNLFYPPLKKFESSFKATCEAQMHWKVPDPLLRGKLRGTISEYVVQAYRAYLDRSVRYTAENLELELSKQIGELFEG